jgi:hypothetical protein
MTDPIANGESGLSSRNKINETIAKGNDFETYNPNMKETDPSERSFVQNQPRFAYADSADFNRPGQTTEGLINPQQNILEDYLVLVFQPNRDGTHKLYTDLFWSIDSTGADFLLELEISGDQGFSKIFSGTIEGIDAGGGQGIPLNTLIGGAIVGNVQTGTDQIYHFGLTRAFEFIEAETYTVTLRWGANGAGIDPAIYSAQIGIMETIKND